MSEAPLILGVSGLRGIVGESLTPEVAVRYAGSFGSWLQEQIPERRPYVLVARDGRAGGEVVYTAAISALLASGCRVRRLGIAMTPTVGMQCDYIKGDAAVIITASHNPQEWNGIKLLVRRAGWDEGDSDGRGIVDQSLSDACAPDAVTAGEIIGRFEGGRIDWWGGQDVDDSSVDDDVEHPHCLRVLDACEIAMGEERGRYWEWFEERSKLRVVIDSVNCSGTATCMALFEDTPVQAIHLYGENTGIFPHTPEPTRENLSGAGGLCDAVPGLKADVGFAQDPDADRLAIVDELGNYIGEEYTLVLCAAALMEGRKGSRLEAGCTKDGKPVFVVNLSTSRMIDDVAAHYGAEVVRTAVGEANVVERMKALTADGRDVVMGGEGNGGVIWAEVTYVRDSLSAMALTLSLMARTGKTVSELVKMIEQMGPGRAGYSIIKKKADLASKADAVPVVEHLTEVFERGPEARVDTQDGVRVDWDAKGIWAHVRASNTEPIMRVIVEAPTGELAEATAAMVEARIAEVRS